MSLIEVRQIVTTVEEIWHEGGPRAERPLLKGAIAVVLKNPYAGRYEPDIMPMMDALKPLGLDLSNQLGAALGGDTSRIEAYGKGAIVGAAGELEHGALWHVPGGYAMRDALGDTRAIVPSTKKVAGPGARIDIPVTHINACYVRSHFGAVEVGVPGSPQADEMVLILVMTTGARIHERVGGLRADQISVWDGQR